MKRRDNRKMNRCWRPVVQVCGSLLLISAPALVALEKPEGEGSPVTEEVSGTQDGNREVPAPAAGLRVFVDPETGALTSKASPEQTERLSDWMRHALSRTAEGLESFPLTQGGIGLHLGGRFQSATVVRVRPDGNFEWSCVDHHLHAEQSLQPAASVSEPQLEEK